MDETKLREQLDRLAGDAGLPDPAGRRTLARARRRRLVNAGATSLAVITLVVAGLTGVRVVLDEPVTIGRDPSPPTGPAVEPSGFQGLWPETDAEALAVAQASADEGHAPLRTTAEGTALEAVTTLLGWDEADVIVAGVDGRTESTTVEMRNRRFADGVPSVEVTVQQLGVQGEGGVWTVVAMSTSLIHVVVDRFDSVPTLQIAGEVTTLFDGAPALELLLLSGPTPDETIGRATFEFTSDRRFQVEIEPLPTPDGRAVLLVSMPDAVGDSLGATLVDVPVPIGEPEPAIHLEGAPPDVAATAQRILDGVLARDLDALAELIDPNRFVYGLDDGSDPIPAWREDPTVLDPIPDILRLPFVVQEIDGYGTFYAWPYLIEDGALDEITEQERLDLHSLGISDAGIEQMQEFGGYIGPRLAIDASGIWRNYVVGGD